MCAAWSTRSWRCSRGRQRSSPRGAITKKRPGLHRHDRRADGRQVAGGALVVVGVLILAALLRYLLRELLRAAGLGATDRFFGALFGIARAGGRLRGGADRRARRRFQGAVVARRAVRDAAGNGGDRRQTLAACRGSRQDSIQIGLNPRCAEFSVSSPPPQSTNCSDGLQVLQHRGRGRGGHRHPEAGVSTCNRAPASCATYSARATCAISRATGVSAMCATRPGLGLQRRRGAALLRQTRPSACCWRTTAT